MNVVLYSTGCPRCKVLKTKLDNKNVTYTTITDVDKMSELGIMEVPVLVVDDNTFNFSQAIEWVNSL